MRRSPRRLIAAAAAITVPAAVGLAAAANAAPEAPAWAVTLTKAIPLKAPALGAEPAATPVHLALALQPRDAAGAAALLKQIEDPSSPSYHHFLTPDQYAARFSPTPQAVAQVVRYLQQSGFSSIEVSGNRLLVSAEGNVGQATRAFHTAISRFRVGDRTVYANTVGASVPAALGGVVQSVIGLNDVVDYTPHPKVAAPHPQAGSPVFPNVLKPGLFANTYDAVAVPTGARTSIAILTEGDLRPVLKDLATAQAKNHLPRVPVRVLPIGPQSADLSGLDEFDMDTQVSTAVAGGLVQNLYLYNVGSLVDPYIVGAIERFVSDNKARAMSASIGGCDLFPYLDGSLSATDVAQQQGALQGQTLFASSGDNGSQCGLLAAVGVPLPPPGTNWPASGMYTTGVGGTSLVTDSRGFRVSEVGWVGSGGGFSEVENPGYWTQASDPNFNAEYVLGGRAVPDIALDADPNVATAAEVWVDGQPLGVGGTSLSSPMALGFWSRLETAHANRLGLASIAFYRLYDKANPGTLVPGSPIPVIVPSAAPGRTPGFYDIVIGNNGGYTARLGYDEVTGVGVFDVRWMNAVIR